MPLSSRSTYSRPVGNGHHLGDFWLVEPGRDGPAQHALQHRGAACVNDGEGLGHLGYLHWFECGHVAQAGPLDSSFDEEGPTDRVMTSRSPWHASADSGLASERLQVGR